MSQSNNPLTQYFNNDFPKQYQDAPAVQAKMEPVPDCGEESYKGSGKLTGKKALITGGDSGIGRAAAIAYAREGADVFLNYLPEEQQDAEEVKALVEAAGQKAYLLAGDLSDETFCQQLVKEAHESLGGIDILALVAGKQQAVEDIMDLSTEQLRKTYEINVFSLFWVVKAALPLLKEGASIITTTSVQGYNPSANLLDYASTKFAINGFTRGLAKQVAPKGIRVNSVAPGPIWTPLQISGGQPSENIPQFGQDTPLKRSGQPVELSGVYVFLASDDASYVTAQIYGVTGGIELA
ncbi:SDR family oxidoreductase [Exiguobacterium antarcticum]|uniref:SDR family oxidoreductase n=1 Tax=Exiguobacterium antarcticum TaxID=132920 RepID=UPI000285ED98|nr:SDR family oxidoreductase [Exiguobacterium antarcticum]AFS71735.1 Short-chain dehydrogenase/reductase SDR [Exiguobacterium antarcticum B7]